jgi:hypothetical protein
MPGNKIGRASSTHEGCEKCIQTLSENLMRRDDVGNLDIDERLIGCVDSSCSGFSGGLL